MKSLLLTAALVAAAALAHAQPTSGGPAPGTTPVTEVPLDGGASFLLAGGVAYGLRKLRPRRAR
jgi:hypothetical protein